MWDGATQRVYLQPKRITQTALVNEIIQHRGPLIVRSFDCRYTDDYAHLNKFIKRVGFDQVLVVNNPRFVALGGLGVSLDWPSQTQQQAPLNTNSHLQWEPRESSPIYRIKPIPPWSCLPIDYGPRLLQPNSRELSTVATHGFKVGVYYGLVEKEPDYRLSKIRVDSVLYYRGRGLWWRIVGAVDTSPEHPGFWFIENSEATLLFCEY
jgi:hypothetical protein